MMISPMALMTRGVLVDLAMRDRVRDAYALDLEGVEADLNTKTGAFPGWSKPLNPRSHPQVKSFFYDTLGVPEIYKHVPGRGDVLTCDRSALEQIAKDNKDTKPFIDLIFQARDLTKKRSVLKSGVDPDGRMRTSVNVAATETGRWSNSTNVFGGGTNLQNITDLMRRIFIPNPRFKMVYSDLDRAESLCVAYLAQDDATRKPTRPTTCTL